LEERFDFIENETLRENLAINLQYILYLIKREERETLPGPISYSIFKNIILYTASIVEGILTYTFKLGIDKSNIDESKVMKKETKFKEIKQIHKDTKLDIVSAKRVTSYEKFHFRRTSFNDVIRAAKKAKIIDNKLADDIHKLREKRNKIHLASLEKVDNYYDKKEVDEAFKLTSKLIDVSENYILQFEE